jgi:ketosteroid isomerase-like protein
MLIAVISCQQTTQNGQTDAEYQAEAKEEITRLVNLYYEVWDNEDLDSVMSFCDEGIINRFYLWMSMDWQECHDVYKDLFDNSSVEDVEYEIAELLIDQAYAIETGWLKQKFITNDRQDTTFFDMRSMTVWKKQADGNWKVFRIMGQQ